MTSRERSRIFGKPSVDTSKPKQAIINYSATSTRAPVEPTETLEERLTELIAGNQAVVEEVDTQMSRLEDEAGGLVYEFDPARKPALATAISSVFKGAGNKITFKMYRAALELDAEISLEMGRALSDDIL